MTSGQTRSGRKSAKMMTSKRDKRWETKKRKVKAFMQMARLNSDDVAAEKLRKRPTTNACDDTIHKILKRSPSDNPQKGDDPQKCHSVDPRDDESETASSDDEQMDAVLHLEKGDILDKKPQPLSAKELAEVRVKIRARQRAGLQKPKFYLTLENLAPASCTDPTTAQSTGDDAEIGRSPLFVLDLQHLLLYAVQGNLASYKPRWCKLLRWTKVTQTVVIILEGVSADDYHQHSDWFPFLQQQFDAKEVEMIATSQYGVTVAEELFKVPRSWTQTKKVCRVEKLSSTKVGKSLHTKLDRMRDIISVLLPETVAKGLEKESSHNEKVSRCDLILNTHQLIQEACPMPINTDQFQDFVYTSEDYSPVTDTSPMFAIDCEMCQTAVNQSELTRVSVVNEQLEILYDTLVKPRNTIINYLTRYSGITKNMLKDVTTTVEDVQAVIQALLPSDAILCGQSLNGDLRAVKMFHPYVIDTSVIYNLNGHRIIKPGLKKLSQIFLGKMIQTGHEGHDSVEDATSCMELVQLKLTQGKEFGDVILGGMIYPTPSPADHIYQAENSSTHVLLPPSSAAALVANTKQMVAVKTQNSEHSTGESTPKTNCLSEVTPRGADTSGNIERKRVFFQRPGSACYDSFFTIAQENKKSVTLVDCPDFLSSYIDETGMTTQSVTSDKEAVRKTKMCLWDQFLVCTHLRRYTDSTNSTEAAREAIVRKLDKRVRELLAHVGENALVTVLLSGRGSDATCQNALCLTKIT